MTHALDASFAARAPWLTVWRWGAIGLCSAVLSACVVVPDERYPSNPYGQSTVYVDAPPPAPIYEVTGPQPGLGYVWVDGHWSWQYSRYVWMRGYWQAPRAGYQWVPHAWSRDDRGWRLREGRWDRRPGDDRDGSPYPYRPPTPYRQPMPAPSPRWEGRVPPAQPPVHVAPPSAPAPVPAPQWGPPGGDRRQGPGREDRFERAYGR